MISARVVLPSGEVREFSGVDLDLISDAEGITGLISQVTFKIRPLEAEAVTAIACPDAHDMQHLVQQIVDSDLPIWSVMFINPRMAELKNKSPLMEHMGHPAEERVILPAAYIITLTYRAADRDAVDGAACTSSSSPARPRSSATASPSTSGSTASSSWSSSASARRWCRPRSSCRSTALGDVMDEIERKVDQPVVKEGVDHHERRRRQARGRSSSASSPATSASSAYNFVFGLVLTIMKIAEKHGGRPYTTGLYFASKADEILGGERAKRMQQLQARGRPATGSSTRRR